MTKLKDIDVKFVLVIQSMADGIQTNAMATVSEPVSVRE